MVKREGENRGKGGWRNDSRSDGGKADVDKGREQTATPKEMKRSGRRQGGIYRGNHFWSGLSADLEGEVDV